MATPAAEPKQPPERETIPMSVSLDQMRENNKQYWPDADASRSDKESI
jgi:hypothetical protein